MIGSVYQYFPSFSDFIRHISGANDLSRDEPCTKTISCVLEVYAARPIMSDQTSMAILAAILNLVRHSKKDIWLSLLELTCSKLKTSQLSKVEQSIFLAKMLYVIRGNIRSPMDFLPERYMLGLLTALLPLVKQITELGCPAEDCFVLDLVILILSIMLDAGFAGAGLRIPDLDAALESIMDGAPSMRLGDVLAHKAWYAKNLLRGMVSIAQVKQEKIERYKAIAKTTLSLCKLGGDIVGAVVDPLTLLSIGDDLISVYQNFTEANKKIGTYDEAVCKIIEEIQADSLILYSTRASQVKVDSYLTAIKAFFKNKEHYGRLYDGIVAKEFMDVIFAYLRTEKNVTQRQQNVVSKLLEALNEMVIHIKRHFQHAMSGNRIYKKISTYLFYNFYHTINSTSNPMIKNELEKYCDYALAFKNPASLWPNEVCGDLADMRKYFPRVNSFVEKIDYKNPQLIEQGWAELTRTARRRSSSINMQHVPNAALEAAEAVRAVEAARAAEAARATRVAQVARAANAARALELAKAAEAARVAEAARAAEAARIAEERRVTAEMFEAMNDIVE